MERPGRNGGGEGAGGNGGAEPAPLSWSRAWGGDDEEVLNSVAFTPDEHLILGGFWWPGYEPFDLGCGDLGGSYENEYEIFVARMDETGECVWSQSLGAPTTFESAWDTIHDLAVDPYGDVVFTGNLGGDIDFAPGAIGGETVRVGIASTHVVKLDGLSGTHRWSVVFGGNEATVTGYGIATDGAGAVLVTGRLYRTAWFGSNALSPTSVDDAFVVKLDGTSGDTLWASALNYAYSDQGRVITADADHNVIVAGAADAVHAPAGDVFVAKLDGASGSPVWQKLWLAAGPSDSVDIEGVAVLADGDVILAGALEGKLQVVPPLVSQDSDGFVMRVRGTDGSVVWTKALGGPDQDGIFDLAVDDAGTIYVAGRIGAPPATREYDLYFAALDSDGTVLWERSYGAEHEQWALATAIGPRGQLALAGPFTGELQIAGGDTLTCEVAAGVACDPFQHDPNVFGAVFMP